MTNPFLRVTAAALLLVGGSIVAFSALGIAAARIAIAAGLPVAVTPADVALLDDLAQLVPFIAAFATANIVAAVALIGGSAWADRLATTLAATAVGIGLFAMFLLILGGQPRALGGLEIIGAFAGLYGAVIVALALGGKSIANAPRLVAV